MGSDTLQSLLIDYAIDRVAAGARPSQIRREIEENGSTVSDSVMDAVLDKAKEEIRKRCQAPTQEKLWNLEEFYRSMMSNERASPKDRLNAAAQYHELLQSQGEVATEDKDILEICQQMKDRFGGNGVHLSN